MNFDILQKPPTSGDQREMYRWLYTICELLNGIKSIFLEHNNTQGIASADDTSSDATGYKHVTDAQVKVYGDHVRIIAENPHDTDLNQLGDVSVTALAVGENLVWDGTDWVNAVPTVEHNATLTGLGTVASPLGVLVSGTYANNAAALAGGLVAGNIYKTSVGVLMVVY